MTISLKADPGGTFGEILINGTSEGKIVAGATSADTTAGRLLKVGDFGLGQLGNVIAPTDLDSIFATGFYRVDNGISYGLPVNVVTLYNHRLNNTIAAVQQASDFTTARMWVRRQAAGVWQPWREIYNQESVLGAVSQSGGVPTGAFVERGSNANGEYVRFADGTQICWRNPATASYNITTAIGSLFRSAAQVFSYPAAFSETPTGCAAVTGSDGRVWVGTCSTGASWSILLFSAASGAGISETVRLVAVGRWF